MSHASLIRSTHVDIYYQQLLKVTSMKIQLPILILGNRIFIYLMQRKWNFPLTNCDNLSYPSPVFLLYLNNIKEKKKGLKKYNQIETGS